MPEGWNFKHEGTVQGPVSLAKLEQLAGVGALLPSDPVWPEGGDPLSAMEALAILELDCFRKVLEQVDQAIANAPRVETAAPDWLPDVAAGPVAPPAPSVPLPSTGLNWLSDVERPTAPASAAPTSKKAIPSVSAPKPRPVVKLTLPPAPSDDAEEPEERGEEIEPFQIKRRDLVAFALGGLAVGLAVLLGWLAANRSRRQLEEPPNNESTPEPSH